MIECVYRVTHPIIMGPGNLQAGLGYYKYKYNSIMFTDSNFVGIFLLALYFLCVYLSSHHSCKFTVQKILLAIMIVGTFSKAAIASLFLFAIIFQIKIKRKYKFAALIAAIGIVGPVYLAQVLRDGSLVGKLTIFTNTFNYLRETSIDRLLFGVGFGNPAKFFNGTFAGHNLLVTYLVEAGIVGTGLLLLLWIIILKESDFKAAVVMGPVFLDAMSLIGHAIPFVYCAFAIIIALQRKEKCECDKGETVVKEKCSAELC